jgi:hypothetical protein
VRLKSCNRTTRPTSGVVSMLAAARSRERMSKRCSILERSVGVVRTVVQPATTRMAAMMRTPKKVEP